MRLILSKLNPQQLEILFKLDAATCFLMFGIGIRLMYEFFRLRTEGVDDRAVRLILAISILALVFGLEMLSLGISRVTVIAGLNSDWFLNSNWRIIIPTIGMFLGLGLSIWLALSEAYCTASAFIQIFAVGLVTLSILIWPEPMHWILLQVYFLIEKVH